LEQVRGLRILVTCPTALVVGLMETQHRDAEVKTGCDFWTAVIGDKEALRNVRSHLSAVIDRAYARHKIL